MSRAAKTVATAVVSEDFRLGEWSVQPTLRRMQRGDEVVALGHRLCHLLCRLAGAAGEVVTRDELLDAVWGEVVISEEGLTVAVSELRRLLGDDPQQPRFIETIRGVGYRLVCPVEPMVEEHADARMVSATRRVSHPFELLPLLPRSWLFRAGAALVLAAAAVAVFRPQAHQPRRAAEAIPLTTMPGREIHPAIVPGGRKVVFAADQGGGLDLFVVEPGADAPVRLSFDPGDECWPAVTPDGRTVAYAATTKEPASGAAEFGIFSVSLAGGPSRRILSTPGAVNGLCYSPDGRRLVYAMDDGLWLLDLESRSVNALPVGASVEHAHDPVFSPDGRHIAFVSGTLQLSQVYVYRVDMRWYTRVALSQRQIAGLDWSAAGNAVVFAAAPAGIFQLWRVDLDSNTLSRLSVATRDARYPAIGREQQILVYQEMPTDSDVWRVQLEADGGGVLATAPLISSTRLDGEAHSSAVDGEIAFVSARSGHRELWSADAQGRGARRLTDFRGPFVSHPRWSPDGRRLAFTLVSPRGVPELWVMDVSSAESRQVSRSGHRLVLEEWSGDGQDLYALSPAVGGWKVVRIAVADGEERWVLPVGCRLVGELENRDLLYVDADGDVLRRRRAVDGELVPVIELPEGWHAAVVRDDRVVVIIRGVQEEWQLAELDPAGGSLNLLGRFSGPAAEHNLNADLTADGRFLIFDHHRDDDQSDLMLVPGVF